MSYCLLPPRSLLLATTLFLSFSPAARAQDFEGVFTAKVKAIPGGGEMKTFIKGTRSRMEMNTPGQGMMAVISDPGAGETYLVMPTQSMYMVMKMAEAERLADSLVRGYTPPDVKFTAIGKKEEVAGYECEFFRITVEKSYMDVCLGGPGLGLFRGGASIFGGPPVPGRPSRPMEGWMKEISRRGSFPLKVIDDKGMVVLEVTSIEKKSLEASLFTPPAGFRRMEMPSFGRPPQN